MIIATIRAFIQLIAIGYALNFIFGQESPIWTLAVLIIMLLVAGRTAGVRGEQVPNSSLLALAAIGVGSLFTLGTLIGLRIFTFDPQTIIPIGGMIIGNSMTTASLVMNRLANDFHSESDQIEVALSLGATSQQASEPQFRAALKSAMIPIVDTTKTVGLIKLPGAMTGMILAGAPPLEAVQIQMIVMYMLVGAAAFTGLTAAYLTYRMYFTQYHQLILPES
jgi:putative ABC transport system permease protein